MLLITTEERKQFCRNTKTSVLRPDSDIAKSMYERRNVLALVTVEELRLRSSLTVRRKYALDAV